MNEQNNNKPAEPINSNTEEEFSLSQKKPKRKAWRVLRTVILVLGCIAIIIGAAYLILFQVGKAQMHNNTGIVNPPPIGESDAAVAEDEDDGGRTIKYNGATYQLNENIVTILCMGIDNENIIEDSGVVGENGQADALFLQTMDVKTGKTVLIGIPRDSMVDVDVYSTDGNFIRTDNKQICLAYAYGDGKKTSCDNVIKSVSRLLYGMPIEYYCAMDLKPIGILNDAVGGVTVTALETIDLLGGLVVKKGEVITLKGNEANYYVRYRDNSVLDSNIARMKRQQQYLTAFSKSALSMTKKDITTPVKLLNKVSKYVTTNLDASKITYLTTTVLTNNYNGEFDFRVVQGKVVKGEKYAEFDTDGKALYELILDVFYNKVS